MNIIYQVSTLQALMMGYSKKVAIVKDFMQHGDTGLGTFLDVDGEMICVDGHCYQAGDNGSVKEADPYTGVSFASVENLSGDYQFDVTSIERINDLTVFLNNEIESHFGLNSMHMARIDATFKKVYARSEYGVSSQHVELKDILSKSQKSFEFNDVEGSLVCLYYPDYMQGINAAGWHFHFISKDKKLGGHVFDIQFEKGFCKIDKVESLQIQLPSDASFDTYTLNAPSTDAIKAVEQSDK